MFSRAMYKIKSIIQNNVERSGLARDFPGYLLRKSLLYFIGKKYCRMPRFSIETVNHTHCLA